MCVHLIGDSCAHKGAHVIGTVSTEDKARLAKANGAEHIVLYRDVPFDEVANQVIALTPNSEGVHAVFDGVGKGKQALIDRSLTDGRTDTFECSLQAVRRKGSLVSIGNASGAIEPCVAARLARIGELTLGAALLRLGSGRRTSNCLVLC